MWVRKWKQASSYPEILIDVLKACDETAFPNIRVLLQLALTLPITSCESERSFSQLKLIKTSRHSTMAEYRLSALALIKINQARLEKLRSSSKMAKLVQTFYQLHPRRMKLEFLLSDWWKQYFHLYSIIFMQYLYIGNFICNSWSLHYWALVAKYMYVLWKSVYRSHRLV